MFSIGDFARHGRVSIRMLRHYDAIGLLRPAHVDECSGYRFYEAAQLSELNRVVALRGLGFRLDQVQTMLDEHIGVEQLRGMLRLRQAELEAGLTSGVEQLARVETRLRTIESEGQMPSEEVVVKRIDAMRVAELTDVAATFTPEGIGPVIRPLCARLGNQLATGTLQPAGRLITYYEQRPGEDDEVVIHAAVPIKAAPAESNGLSIVDLVAVEQAATIVHRGAMDGVESSVDTLARWIDHHGYRAVGFPRELYLEVPEDESKWITELQQPIVVA